MSSAQVERVGRLGRRALPERAGSDPGRCCSPCEPAGVLSGEPVELSGRGTMNSRHLAAGATTP